MWLRELGKRPTFSSEGDFQHHFANVNKKEYFGYDFEAELTQKFVGNFVVSNQKNWVQANQVYKVDCVN